MFGRITATLLRIAQGLLTCHADAASCAGGRHRSGFSDHAGDYLEARARAHLYVDDAAIALAGEGGDASESFDVFILFL